MSATGTSSRGARGTSRLTRLVAATALACGSVPLLGAAPAAAADRVLTPANWGYFNATGIDKPDESPAAPPNLTSTLADGVPAGNLAVAAQGGQENKASFLFFDLYDLPTEAVVTKAVLTMTPVPSAPPETLAYNAAPGAVAACQAGSEGFKEDDGVGLKNAPARKCDAFKAVGTAGPAGSYQWDITGLAQTWVAGTNDGLALTRADDAPGATAFQVVLGLPATAKLALSYTLPAAEVPTVTLPPVTTPPVTTPDVGVVAPSDSGFVPAPEMPVPAPVDNVPPAPAPAQPEQQVVTRPVAALSTSMRPTGQFWLAGALLAAALVVVALVLGDPSAPVPARSSSRLDQVLAQRQRRRGPAPAPLRVRAI